jgi:hypothetical protein
MVRRHSLMVLLRLAVALDPAPTWGDTVESRLGLLAWRGIQEETLARADGLCQFCAEPATVAAEPLWRFQSRRRRRVLRGFVAVCQLCLLSRHRGLAAVLGRAREVDHHLQRLRGDDPDALERHLTRAFWLWRRRSLLRWESDLGPWAPRGDITGPLDAPAWWGVSFDA